MCCFHCWMLETVIFKAFPKQIARELSIFDLTLSTLWAIFRNNSFELWKLKCEAWRFKQDFDVCVYIAFLVNEFFVEPHFILHFYKSNFSWWVKIKSNLGFSKFVFSFKRIYVRHKFLNRIKVQNAHKFRFCCPIIFELFKNPHFKSHIPFFIEAKEMISTKSHLFCKVLIYKSKIRFSIFWTFDWTHLFKASCLKLIIRFIS